MSQSKPLYLVSTNYQTFKERTLCEGLNYRKFGNAESAHSAMVNMEHCKLNSNRRMTTTQ